MNDLTRRRLLEIGVGSVAALSAGIEAVHAQAIAAPKLVPEKDATLHVIRPSQFVQGDEDLWRANTKKFMQETGIVIKLDLEPWENLRPKAAVAATTGRGPDIVYGWFDDAHQYPDKLHDLTDTANYLGSKYGGWYDVCKKYGMKDGKWIAMPLGAQGARMVYRESWMKEAGFDAFPADLAGLLDLCRKLQAKNHPPGFALGNAVSDANSWCHWLIWAFGGRVVNEKDEVIINSRETIAALQYATELYKTFIPGTLSWLDPSNNKAFSDGSISLTSNAISIYYAAKNSNNPTLRTMAADIGHAKFPIGPAGKPTELHVVVSAMVFRYTKYPNAAKEYIRFMMESQQYEPWQEASTGYFTQPLIDYEKSKIWTSDPKITPYRDVTKNTLWSGYAGTPGKASAACLSDFIVVDMIAAVCSGSKSATAAAADAQKRAERYYRA